MKYASVKGGIRNLIEYRRLLGTLITRDLRVKYRDTFIGFWWVLIQPLLMLSTYALVFGYIFGSRWQNKGSTGDFVLLLFCGLIIYVMFSDTVNRATTVIRSQPNFIKKVVFPVEILPMVILGSAIFNAVVNFTILFILILKGLRQVEDDVWLVSFMDYDMAYFDMESSRVQTLENPFGPKVLGM